MAPSFDMEKAAENSTPYSKWWPWGKTPQGIVHLQAVNAPVEGLHFVITKISIIWSLNCQLTYQKRQFFVQADRNFAM